MANNLKISNAAATAMADALMALLNGGFIDIYDGAQPATPDTAISTQVKLARLTFGNPAAPGSTNGVATANAITADSSADATGTAAWFRALTSGGAAIMDGTVGVSGCDMTINSVSIIIATTVAATSFVFTQSKS